MAAVDMGTNSTRLLIADHKEGILTDVERIEQVTGLGRGVDDSGRLSREAIDRTARVLEMYGARIRDAGVEAVRAVATSAARDAANRDTFVEIAQRALGFGLDVIEGEEEAGLVFLGATRGLPDPGAALVIDIGGGSTEIATDQGGISIDIGSVRITERRLPAHPASPGDISKARREAARVMNAADLPRRVTAMGSAGTWTSLAAIHIGAEPRGLEPVEGVVMHMSDLEDLVDWLGSLTLEAKQAIPSLDPERAPVILGGAIVAETSLRILELDTITVTLHDLLDGICNRLVAEKGGSSGAAQ